MAFFRNYTNDTVSHNILDENEERQNAATFQSSPLNEDVDGTYSERGFDMNMDVQYQSDAEPGCSIRQQNQTTIGNVAGPVDSHYQPSGRRMSVSGKWGSTFWKDCQPMGQREGSDSAKDLQAGYKEAYHSEDNLSNDRSQKLDSENENEEDKELNTHQSGQVDVPADEMLSDEYYEQDEDNQSDHVHYKGYNNPTNSRSLPKTGSAIHSNSRASRANHENIHYNSNNHGHIDDADIDYEEEEDEDDPEDVDFEPYDPVHDGGRGKKHDQAWDVSDEEPESDDDNDLSDYEDDYITKKPKVRQQGKGFRKSSSGLERKPFHASNRQKKKTSYQEDCSEEDSDNDNDEGFRSLARRGTTLRQNNGRLTNNIGHSSEVRSSTRSVRKVSYVESEDSEDIYDGKNRKNQKDDIEEEDADVIEKVLWHQPKGLDAGTNNKSAVPVLLSQLFDTEQDWNEMEFLIKWKGQSHLHCHWKSLSDLQHLSGFKKVLNYMKKVTEEIRYRTALSREEVMMKLESLQDFLVFVIFICTSKSAIRWDIDGPIVAVLLT